jgi:predicted ATPase with chaperone activity
VSQLAKVLTRASTGLDATPLPKELLLSQQNDDIENSETIRARVLDCYNRQLQRQGKLNDQLK